MPNWCYNTIEIEGPKAAIDKFEKHLDDTKGKDWFSYFVKPETELKDDEWYGWNLENYGCKWNCDAYDWQRVEPESISFTFDSPWAPPIALYHNIENIEIEDIAGNIDYYRVSAQYLEEGMQFVGRFDDGQDECYEYSDLESLDDIPEEIIENWGIRDRMLDDLEQEEWLNEQEDELSEEEMAKRLEELKAEFEKLTLEENNDDQKTEKSKD